VAKWIMCQTCHGNGVLQKEVKPGVWKEIKCPAKCNKGKVNTGTV